MSSVLFYVQHLVGIGHLIRARLIADALAAAGFDVHLASGGMPVEMGRSDAFHTHQLAPIRVDDGDYAVLRDGDGRPIDDAYRRARRDSLLSTFESVAPAVLICETFPFGRRALRFELLPLLERAVASARRPVVIASVRDILQQRTGERAREMLETANRWFDAILIHGDPRFASFDTTFPLASALEAAVHYTGFVSARAVERAASLTGRHGPDTRAANDAGSRREVVVSAGGGSVGIALLGAALAARERTRLRNAPWRLLAGPNLPDDAFRRLVLDAPHGVVVERARDDFAALLRGAFVSVSQAGYNTVLDVVGSGARVVLVPYVEHGETEQRARAARVSELRLATVVDEARLSPARLAAAIDEAAARSDWGRWDFDDDGAARSAALVGSLANTTRSVR